MFSSKTETLISYARRYILAKKNVVLIKYLHDKRYSVEEICSHNKTSIKATFVTDNLTSLLEEKELKEAHVVLIDEGQFFNDADTICDYLATMGKIVIVACLNGNYKREPFPIVSILISQAEEIICQKAVCSLCGEDGHFTKKLASDNHTILIGGSEIYTPRCRMCFLKD
jgi:thymidine kinase